MTVDFNKDAWIKLALINRYLIAFPDGRVLRANHADAQGKVSANCVHKPIKMQTHKATGRVYFNLTYMGVTKSVLLNRVIAIRFLPNPLNLPVVNHIDGDKQNNAVRMPDGKMQLEWATGSDNEKHAHRTGLKSGRGSANSNAKLSADDVHAIRASIDPVTVLTERYGVSRSTIANVIKRSTWRHI